MIFAFLLLLQVVQYNVQGKHFLVETEDGNSLEENGPGQVYEYFSILSGAGGVKKFHEGGPCWEQQEGEMTNQNK